MSEIKFTGEMRTDFDCEITKIPAGKYAEAVFNINGEEIVLEISAEEKVIVAIMAGEDAVWKGTLEGLKKLLKEKPVKRQQDNRVHPIIIDISLFVLILNIYYVGEISGQFKIFIFKTHFGRDYHV